MDMGVQSGLSKGFREAVIDSTGIQRPTKSKLSRMRFKRDGGVV